MPIGAAIATQVQATATTRTKVLTARFICFLLTCGFPGSGNPCWVELYLACQEKEKFSWNWGIQIQRCLFKGRTLGVSILGFGECAVYHVFEHGNQGFGFAVRLHVHQGFVPALRDEHWYGYFAPVQNRIT